MDTPLPPIIDPAIDDTARHPLAEPLREHLAAAGGLKLLRAEPVVNVGDSMSLTIPAETPRRAPSRPTTKAKAKAGRGAKKPRTSRGFHARAQSLELQADPAPAPRFGD